MPIPNRDTEHLGKPHNPAYSVIRPKGELEIFGVMVGLARRYQH